MNRVHDWHINVLDPTPTKIWKQIVYVDYVWREVADRLKRIGAAASCDSIGGAKRIEAVILKLVGVCSEELHLMSSFAKSRDLRFDN